MLNPLAIYIASVVGGIALWMMMPNARYDFRKVGGVLGLALLGGLWFWLARSEAWRMVGIERSAFAYYYVFSAIAIVAAVRVICGQKPVYSALWFVMVVLSSAGLFLVLGAEFMAFAMVIIYAGAILVTYMFVLMLASHAGDAMNPEDQPGYDRFARDPLMGVAFGFLLLAVLILFSFEDDLKNNPAAAGLSDAEIIANVLPDRPAARLKAELLDTGAPNPDSTVPSAAELTNVERVGLDLFESHPLGLELAGVILLLSLIGAVVIAKTHVPGEDEVAG